MAWAARMFRGKDGKPVWQVCKKGTNDCLSGTYSTEAEAQQIANEKNEEDEAPKGFSPGL